MAATLTRPLSFPDTGIGEYDQDPNSALQELDRGLKSSNVGEQCEAISRFPSLFEKYPFPILFNSAMLKLADVFRQETAGSNFVRVCVCEVLETSSRHLDKLINVDEFLRRITTVMHSNDPLARALTLRALGLLCGVVGEVRQVQHLVTDALHASHSLELQAAIAAAEKYAAVSKTFAVSMCERLTQMLSALSTPVEVKLQLIKVFQHMHHDAETAATVRGVCLQLLERYPTQRVVITTLHALTQLAAHCLVHIPHQVDLVLSWVSKECRAGVRSAALSELRYLASAAPHAWSPGNVAALVIFTRNARTDVTDPDSAATSLAGLNIRVPQAGESRDSERDQTTAAALNVLVTLTSAPALPHLNLTADCDLVKLSREFVYDANVSIAAIALQLFTNIALYMHDEKSDNAGKAEGSDLDSSSSVAVCSDALNAGVSLLHTLAQQAYTAPVDPASHLAFKVPLVCCVLLARCDQALAVSLSSTLVTLLTDDSLPREAESCSVVVCEALASLGGSKRGVLAPHIPALLYYLHSRTSKAVTKTPENTRLIGTVCSVVFQAYLGHAWDGPALERVMAATKCTDNWTAYRLARQAARYGHHQIAGSVYSSLRSRVCSDQQHYWLTALAQVSSGESKTSAPLEPSKSSTSATTSSDGPITTEVVDDRAKPLTAAASNLYSALANFKACSTVQQPLVFVQHYTRLRAATLTCHSQLVTTCQSMRTSPPPAIATSQVAAMRDEMVRCCRLVQQFTKLTNDFTELARDYGKLYQSQFDADPQTLRNISSLQLGAKLMARAISVLTRPMADHHGYQGGSKGGGGGQAVEDDIPSADSGATVQEQLMAKALARACKTIAQLEQLCVEKKPIVECQLQLLTSVSEQLTAVPLPYPRLFYQSLQRTSIALNITPQPHNSSDCITLQNSSQLAVKVEGVISHGRQAGLFRSIKTVTLLINSSIQSRPPHTLDLKVEPNETLSQTVEPHNDFFSAQFLLAFPVPSQYQVCVLLLTFPVPSQYQVCVLLLTFPVPSQYQVCVCYSCPSLCPASTRCVCVLLLSFPVPSQYQVTVDASVTDDHDETWQTGPRQTLAVKALEDPTNIKPQPPGGPCSSQPPTRLPIVASTSQPQSLVSPTMHQIQQGLPGPGSSHLPPAMPPPNMSPYQTPPLGVSMPPGMSLQSQQLPMQYHQPAASMPLLGGFSRPPP
ncbi:Armadillo-type fold [Trinorchestia longiramus]|nr:Armadillo-type fold [Trinorchestia longiramus]